MLKILILIAALATGCDLFKKDQAPQATIETPAPTKTCKLKVGDVELLAEWKMKNGVELEICALNSYDSISENEFSGWINIAEKMPAAKPGFLAEVDSELPSEFTSFNIKKISDTEVEITRLLEHLANEVDYNATSAILNCKTDKCVLSEEKCVPFPETKVNEEAIANVQKVVQGKLKTSETGDYYDVTIGKVVAAALTGDKRALKLVLDTPKSKLKVDGHSAEVLSDGQEVIKKLIDLRCLKR